MQPVRIVQGTPVYPLPNTLGTVPVTASAGTRGVAFGSAGKITVRTVAGKRWIEVALDNGARGWVPSDTLAAELPEEVVSGMPPAKVPLWVKLTVVFLGAVAIGATAAAGVERGRRQRSA